MKLARYAKFDCFPFQKYMFCGLETGFSYVLQYKNCFSIATYYVFLYAKSKEKVLFYPYSSLFLEYKLKIQSIGVSNSLCCISFLTVSSHLKTKTRQKCVIYEDKPKTRQERVLHNTSKQHTKSVLFVQHARKQHARKQHAKNI